MAFIASSVSPFVAGSLQTGKACALRAGHVAPSVRRTVRSPRITPCMAEQQYPESTVLGLGKDIPSSLYLIGSVIAFLLGSFSVYQSNLNSPLTPDTVNPQFIVGSLLVPISWGLYVVFSSSSSSHRLSLPSFV